MKRKKGLIGVAAAISAMMILLLAACGQSATSESNKDDSASDESVQANSEVDTETQTESAEESTETAEVSDEDGKILVVYFSWSTAGNTEKMASYIQEQTNGNLFEIEPLNPYPSDYEECTDVALAERDENARPEIANLPDSIEEYDAIFIGYPKMEYGFDCVLCVSCSKKGRKRNSMHKRQ